ncbi:MAG TPA: hypothetical protein VMV73_05175 [Candidatus Dormibacteraeota bacterium]|nr:hypothetical protein [Candidatus Dormibacteraeota bacterium]
MRLRERIVPIVVTAPDDKLLIRWKQKLDANECALLAGIVRRVFALDGNLRPFYDAIAEDDPLAWARSGAGRMLASPSVLEDLVKTLCSTNCAFSATRRMIAALVELGGGTFPSAAMLAATPERVFVDVVRMGYRARALRELAERTADASLDVEALRAADGAEEEAVAQTLGSIRGFGPYAVAHAMQLLGFHRPLILDSWTRPSYLRLLGKQRRSDATIRRDFARYGRFAGLAFWLTLTRDWLPSEAM